MTDHSQLRRISEPFPQKYVQEKEGGKYVSHAIVNQRLLGTLGAFDMHVDQVIRGDIAERTTKGGKTWPGQKDAVVGVVLTCIFTIDGKTVSVSEVGEPEGYYMAAHDGERLKKAVSDAFKRCAMRVGMGLDMWSKGSYFLPALLDKNNPAVEAEAPEPDHDAPDPDDVAAAPEPEPEPERTVTEDGEIVDEPDAEDLPERMQSVAKGFPSATQPQRKTIGQLVKALEWTADQVVTDWLKPTYEIEASKDLSKPQADHMINHLQGFVFTGLIEQAEKTSDLDAIANDIKAAKLDGKPLHTVRTAFKARKAELTSSGGDSELDQAFKAAMNGVEIS